MEYNANDIKTLSAGRAFREKLGMYLSADKQEAINLGLRELIVNVQDEYEVYKPKNPYCIIELNTKDKIITVTDNMRGIPGSFRDRTCRPARAHPASYRLCPRTHCHRHFH